jgi:lipopolysaccharide transport system ATP-binding protein
MSAIIKVQNLSKIYRLGDIGTGTVSHDLERWFRTKILKHDDPFVKIGDVNVRNRRSGSEIVYSLKDINFDIERGDTVGIIGSNGAGKSTLLKILSRVTAPSRGLINIKGRVASLLEVGTGFHPELTGRENIFLNGAILGMRKREISHKLEEIIDFSGVERFVDTPVKRYSSGMYVRLAFAVAAHLESEILIVDEVLAVGDAEFQRKCLGKMGEVSKGEGKTVLFVSHNMSAVSRLCRNSILLNSGYLSEMANTQIIIEKYNNKFNSGSLKYTNQNSTHGLAYFKDIEAQLFSDTHANFLKLTIVVNQIVMSRNYSLEFEIVSSNGIKLFFCALGLNQKIFLPAKDINVVELKLPLPKTLALGKYYCNCIIASSGATRIEELNEKIQFEISNENWPDSINWYNDLNFNVGPILIEGILNNNI